MNRLFLTSDLHFGHDNIIRYCSRPFANSSEMNEALIERWNSRVDEKDTVLFLGDFAMGRGVDIDFTVDILEKLNGYKRMILGNHDLPSKWSIGLKKIVEDYAPAKTYVLAEQIHDFSMGHLKFVCCHYPLADWEGKFRGAIHLHGHTHTQYSKDILHQMKHGRVYDVGVDMYGGPVQLTDDLRFLNDPKGWA